MHLIAYGTISIVSMRLKTQTALTAPTAGPSESAPRPHWQTFAHSVGWMVLVAFLVRVLWIVLAHTYRLRTSEDNWGFGWEIGRLGYSLANGHGFSSPFGGDTGPSAWTAPIYPWFVSVAFRLFGNYSRAAAFWLLVFNSAFAALTCWTIYRTARRLFNETVAVWSGWIWALLPYTIFWSVREIWETSVSAFLLSLLFMMTVEMEGDERLSSWIGYGLLWGVAALTNPSALSFFLGRNAASLRCCGTDCNQEPDLPGVFHTGHLGIAVGVEAAHSRSVPVCGSADLLSRGLLCMLP